MSLTDGEMSKPGFFVYVNERLEGFEPRPGKGPALFAAERAAFPEYYEDYFKRAMLGGAVAPIAPMFCVGPVRYKGEAALRKDLDNLKAALADTPHVEAFVPAMAPSGVGQNDYYKSDEEYLFAVAEALAHRIPRHRRRRLPGADRRSVPGRHLRRARPRRRAEAPQGAELYVEAINQALRGISPERVRFHTCYGINEGPRIHEAALGQLVDFMLQINAGAYSFEAANCRHEHEYHLWETREAAGRQDRHSRRHHPRQQHRRASGIDRRAHRALRRSGRPRKRDRRLPIAASHRKQATRPRCTRR